jgi:outer membrane protein assembly factor BamB
MALVRNISVVVLCLSAVVAAAEPTDWPRWRGPLWTGAAAASPPLIESLPAEGLAPLWVSEPIKGARDGGWASPAVAGGKVFLFAHEREQLQELGPAKYPYLDDAKRAGMKPAEYEEYERLRREEGIERAKAYAFREHVYAFDAETGKTVWHNRSDSVYSRWPQSGSPTIVGDKLYVLGGGLNLRCLSTATGDELWVRRLPGEFVDEFFQSSVLVIDGVAVLMAGHLFGIDANTGTLLWEGDPQQTAGTHCSPVAWESAAGPRVVINLDRGVTACFDPHDGRELWRAKTEGGVSTPVVVGDRLLTYGNSRQKGLRCFRLSETGAEELWQFHGTQDKGSSPAVVGGYVYVQGEKRIACVDLETGDAAWTGELDLASPQYTSLVAADGKVFYAYDGLTGVHAKPDAFEPFLQARFNSQNLMASDATLRRLLKLDEIEQQPNGLEQATRIFDREVNRSGPLKCSTPALANGRLYVRTNTAVVCYDLRR